MSKRGVIFSFEASKWKSCTKIVKNLKSSYTKLLDGTNHKFHHYNFSANKAEIKKLSQLLAKTKYEELIFIDSRPHPLFLIKNLARLKCLPEKMTFHLYGDFMLDLDLWQELFELVSETRIKLIVASEKQRRVIRKVVDIDDVLVCPFPVDYTIYNVNEEKRQVARKKYCVGKKDKVFIYTGRISEKKECLKLIDLFSKLPSSEKEKSLLYLAGDFDDLINPVLGIYHRRNTYQFKFLHTFKKYPKSTRDRIKFLGSIGEQELTELYNMADIYLSLSLYNDEDFGMAPIEALISGCRAVLTDWGGYSSFGDESFCKLVDTNLSPDGVSLNEATALRHMKYYLRGSESVRQRQRVSRFYQERFSVSSVFSHLVDLYFEPYFKCKGLTKLGKKLIINKNNLVNKNQKYNSLFCRIYNSYSTEA